MTRIFPQSPHILGTAQAVLASLPKVRMLRSIVSDHTAPQLTLTQFEKRCFAEKIGPGAMEIP